MKYLAAFTLSGLLGAGGAGIMAWRSHGKSNSDLIANLRRNGLINTDRCAKAMANTDRGHYVMYKYEAYNDAPSGIGHGATISAPHMHASAVENLLPFLQEGSRVLDVGSGSGYLLGIFHNLVSPSGTVTGIDHIEELVAMSRSNLRHDGHGAALESGHIEVVTGDGRLGYPSRAPFDVIHVGAAAPTMPQALVDQLASPGRMFIPVGTWSQSVFQVDKDADGNVRQRELMGVRYVPLTDAPHLRKA